MGFRLAPLQMRRDIGMLGVIHRSVIAEGPRQFSKYFVRDHQCTHPNGRKANRTHDKQLQTHRRGRFLDVMSHSLLGLVDIYNMLPQYTVEAPTVSEFQKRLQLMAMEMASSDEPGWPGVYSPRNALWNNKLLHTYNWGPSAQDICCFVSCF